MKKICLLLLAGLLGCAAAWAQFQVSGTTNSELLTAVDDGLQGVDYVLLVRGGGAGMELTYTDWDGEAQLNWYEYTETDLNPTAPFWSGELPAPIAAGHGYILEVDGARQHLWVTEYVPPVITRFEPALDNDQACETTVFDVEMDEASNLRYCDGTGVWHTIKREFTVVYTTKEYPEGGDDWEVKPVEETEDGAPVVSLPATRISVPASLDPATAFTLTGDQFALGWGMEPYEFTATSSPDLVFPVKSHLTSIMTVRDALNEISRPSEAEPTPPIKGSSPLEILFESRPSDPNNTLYDWKIYKGDALLLTRTDEDLRYTFEDFGTYYVKLEVYRDYMNGTRCSMRDSVEVSVSESFLGVPNVFTPNGDGKNDEFRVAYRSLRSFHCWVYSSWCKLVYEWSDPAKGWDGRVNGRKNAPTGTYFYIIKAEGTDGVKHNRKGDINIIR